MNNQTKPLFIPLKTEYYQAFVLGEKDTEYRKYGPGWNERTCWVGRPVVISKGYGKQNRTCGVIRSFAIIDGSSIPGDSVEKCYGTNDIQLAAIGIDLY